MKKIPHILFSLTLALIIILAPQKFIYADAPLAAQLLAQPYDTTGIRVTVTNSGNMYGLATDGTDAWIINQDGNLVQVPLAGLASQTPGSSVETTGTIHPVGWGGASPSWPAAADLSIAYSKGCIYMTNANNTVGQIHLYCIDVSDYSVTDITVPNDKPLPAGHYFAYSNLINFPDGRIGKVSSYQDIGGGIYQSTLRLYTISGTGKNSTLTWSEDILMNDTSNWAVDEHGIATDGTYLYRIQWRDVSPNTKVWQLASGTPSSVVWQGSFTMPFDNMHYIAHNHIHNYYLIGHFNNNHFLITTSADPGPGPGNPLTPAFDTPVPTSNGFTVQVTNYDAAFDWSVGTTAGTVSINETGLITVTGLSSGQSATVTVGTSRLGYPNGSATVEGVALVDDTPPDNPAPRHSSRVVGGFVKSFVPAPQVSLGTPGQCSADLILTQNLHALSRDGVYGAYTKGIVREAKILQKHMNRLGFNSGPEDGIIGLLTDGAIKRMQIYLGTIPDGFVGPITRGLINNSCGTMS